MQKVYFLGKLSGANRKEATKMVRHTGQRVAGRLDADVSLIVIGEEGLYGQDWNLWNDQLDAETQDAFEKGLLRIISEMQFWEMYGNQNVDVSHSLYTPSMLAQLSGLSLSIIRRLQQAELIYPARQIFRLCLFDKEVIIPLKLTQKLLKSGISVPTAISRLRKIRHDKQERLSSVRVEGKDIIFVSEGGSVDQNGQKRLSFV